MARPRARKHRDGESIGQPPLVPPAPASASRLGQTHQIVGDLPSLLSGGQLPTADPTLDYLAGGGGVFPLAGQTILARPGDDLSRDLGEKIYETMLFDPTIWSACVLLWSSIFAGDLQIVPAARHRPEPGRAAEPGSEEAQRLERAQYWADFCQRNLDRMDRPAKQVLWDLGFFGFTNGTKIAEKVTEEGDGQDAGLLCMKALKVKPNISWAYVVDPYGDVVAIRGLIYGGGIADLPPEKFVIHTWMPRDRDPRGRSGLRACYNGWNLKVNTWPLYWTYLDRFANPIPVGTASESAPPQGEPILDPTTGKTVPGSEKWTPTQALAYALNIVGKGRSIAARAGSKIELHQATGNGEAFREAFRLYDAEILKAILTSPRAVAEAEHGSKADAQSSQDNVGQLVLYGREQITNLVEDQICHWLIELNAGKAEADAYCPEVSLGSDANNPSADMLRAWVAAGYAVDETQFPSIDAMFNGLPVRDLQALAERAAQERWQATVARVALPAGAEADGDADDVADEPGGTPTNRPTASAKETQAGILAPSGKGFGAGRKTRGARPARAALPPQPTKADLAAVGVAGSAFSDIGATSLAGSEREDDADPFGQAPWISDRSPGQRPTMVPTSPSTRRTAPGNGSAHGSC